MTRIEAFLICALGCCLLYACNARASCMPMSEAKRIAATSHGKISTMTPAQWQFLRGVFVFNPDTPFRVPYGDRAILITSTERETSVAFFVDGDKACDMVIMTKSGVEILMSLGTVIHAPAGAPSAPSPVPTPSPEPSSNSDERLKL